MGDTIKNYVDGKKIYLEYLADLVVPYLYRVMMDIYNATKKESAADQVMMNFQLRVRNIPEFNQEKVQNLFDEFIFKTKCDWFDELVQIVFMTHTAILTSIVNSKNKIDIDVPTSPRFLFRILIEVARQVYEKPYLFKEMTSPIEILQNRAHVYDIIRNSIHKTIRGLLPMKNIVRFCLNYRGNEVEDDLNIEDEYSDNEGDINLTSGGGMHKVLEHKSEELIKQISSSSDAEKDDSSQKSKEEESQNEKSNEEEPDEAVEESEEGQDKSKEEESDDEENPEESQNEKSNEAEEPVAKSNNEEPHDEENEEEESQNEDAPREENGSNKEVKEVDEDILPEDDQTNPVSEILEDSESDLEEEQDPTKVIDMKGVSINDFIKNRLKRVSSLDDLEDSEENQESKPEKTPETKPEKKPKERKRPVANMDFSIPETIKKVESLENDEEQDENTPLDEGGNPRQFKIV